MHEFFVQPVSLIISWVMVVTSTPVVRQRPATNNAEVPRVSWSKNNLFIDTFPGGNAAELPVLSTSVEMQNVRIAPVPEIAGFVKVVNSQFATFSAGQPKAIGLAFTVPEWTAPGVYDGVIRVTAGNRTFPQTLRVTIRVRQPSPAKLYISKNPNNRFLYRLEGSGGEITDFYGDKDSEGNAIATKVIRRYFLDGTHATFYLDSLDRPASVESSNGSSMTLDWQSQTSVIVHLTIPGEQTPITFPVDFGSVARQSTQPEGSRKSLAGRNAPAKSRAADSTKPAWANSLGFIDREYSHQPKSGDGTYRKVTFDASASAPDGGGQALNLINGVLAGRRLSCDATCKGIVLTVVLGVLALLACGTGACQIAVVLTAVGYILLTTFGISLRDVAQETLQAIQTLLVPDANGAELPPPGPPVATLLP